MEASALHAPNLARRTIPGPLLRLRSDEQLVALFRAGSEEAFSLLHDRYRQRLFAYVRQMLSVATRADAEDVLQDVFVRAYGALRADEREVNVRAWLYRVAHNRCIDQLRRPAPAPADVFESSRTPPLQDPIEAAQRREDLRRLVADVGRLPAQQRSALLMREIDGLAYVDIAAALEVTVPAVKSLLVRARTGLVEAIQARDTDCDVIRRDLVESYERGVKASARARRHLRECGGCRDYRAALKGMRRSFAALSPAVGFAPLAVAAKALGIGGAGGAGAAGGSAIGVTGAAACKVAAVVCTAALATGGAMEAHHLTTTDAPTRERAAVSRTAQAKAPVTHAPLQTSPAVATHRAAVAAPSAAAAADAPTLAERRAARRRAAARAADRQLAADGVSLPVTSVAAPTAPASDAPAKDATSVASGGTEAPADAPPVVKETTGATQPTTTTAPAATAAPAPATGTGTATTPAAGSAAPVTGTAPVPAGPAPEH